MNATRIRIQSERTLYSIAEIEEKIQLAQWSGDLKEAVKLERARREFCRRLPKLYQVDVDLEEACEIERVVVQ